MNEKLTIQQAARHTGLSEYTLRYYERVGLIGPIERNASGHRRYAPVDLGWIEFMTRLRTTGMSIQQMLDYARLSREGERTIFQRLELLEAHAKQLEQHIEDLLRNQEAIAFKIAHYREIEAQCIQHVAEEPEPV
ncbi:MAG: MerR family transcriptional regulator [Anaerolineae bacterium]|nr:MerR family transcriptional regulator [Anaerolineae bacterium]